MANSYLLLMIPIALLCSPSSSLAKKKSLTRESKSKILLVELWCFKDGGQQGTYRAHFPSTKECRTIVKKSLNQCWHSSKQIAKSKHKRGAQRFRRKKIDQSHKVLQNFGQEIARCIKRKNQWSSPLEHSTVRRTNY